MLGFLDGVRVQRQIESINRDIQQIKEVQQGLLTLQKIQIRSLRILLVM